MRPFADSSIWKLIDWIGEKTTISPESVTPILSVQWGWDKKLSNLRIGWMNSEHKDSLYYNGIIFFRIAAPFYIGIMIRWCESCKPSYFQSHIGWKLNGRLAIAFRFQTDTSAAAGMDFPNPGQSVGWSDGGK